MVSSEYWNDTDRKRPKDHARKGVPLNSGFWNAPKCIGESQKFGDQTRMCTGTFDYRVYVGGCILECHEKPGMGQFVIEFSLSKTSRKFGIINDRSRFDIQSNTLNRIIPTSPVLRREYRIVMKYL